MLVSALALCIVFVSTDGWSFGGKWQAPAKRSDYSMYDNQFYRVGDTALDNEVTDCGLVKHQFARGYIRLREYLERMKGCGRKGKMKNIAGIEKSTEDDMPNYKATQQQHNGYYYENHQHVAAYKPHHFNRGNPQPQRQQTGDQRSTSGVKSFYKNFGIQSQVTGPLSYSTNTLAQPFLAQTQPQPYQPSTFHFQNRQQIISSPDPQRYYTGQTAMLAHAYGVPIAVGQPMYKANPSQPQVAQAARTSYAHFYGSAAANTQNKESVVNSPAENPDKEVVDVAGQQSVDEGVVTNTDQGGRNKEKELSQDIDDEGNENDVIDEGTEARIVDDMSGTTEVKQSYNSEIKSGVPIVRDPAPSLKVPMPVPSLKHPVALLTPKVPIPSSSSPKDPVALPSPTAPISVPSPSDPVALLNPTAQISVPSPKDPVSLPSPKDPVSLSSPQIAIPAASSDKPQLTAKSHDNSNGTTPNPSNSGSEKKQTNDSNNRFSSNPANPDNEFNVNDEFRPKDPDVEDDIKTTEQDNEEDTRLNGFLKPNAADSQQNTDSNQQQEMTSPMSSPQAPEVTNLATQNAAVTAPEQKPKIAINLDVLKKKILHSTNSAFLKRMLTLIRKITHHKDFPKLAVMQKSAIMGVGKAVGSAVGNPYAIRSHIESRPPTMQLGDYTAYTAPSNDVTNNQYINTAHAQLKPPYMKPGEYTSYTYPHAQGAETATQTTYRVSKKFQIERNPYQASRPMAYVPPYFSLQRLNYGIYNGNAP